MLVPFIGNIYNITVMLITSSKTTTSFVPSLCLQQVREMQIVHRYYQKGWEPKGVLD